MKVSNRVSFFVMVILLSVAGLAMAAVPQTINYQGYLKNTNGTPVTASTSIRFSLYSSNPARNNPVWRETQNVTPSNGIYSTQLGSVTPITAPFDAPYYLGIQAETDPEMALQPLSSVPYALRSVIADSVPDNSITDAKIAGPIAGTKIGSAGLNADTVDNLHAADFSRSGATDTGQANLLALIASLQAQIDTMTQQANAASPQVDNEVTISGPGGPKVGSQVAMDAQGNAIAVWQDYTAEQYRVWSNRYIVGTGWGVAVLLEADASFPQIAMDAAGNAIAVWQQNGNIRSSYFSSAEKGWGAAVTIETGSGAASLPQVAMDIQGNATAVWSQTDGILTSIWANRYSIGSGWGIASLVETGNAGDAIDPHVAMDGLGNAIAVWSQSDGTRLNIYANRYRAGGGWGATELIENSLYIPDKPMVAMDAQGNATVVCQMKPFGTIREYDVLVNRYTVGVGWGIAEVIATGTTLDPPAPRVAMDVKGNAQIVWAYQDITSTSTMSIWSKRYTSGIGWGTATLIELNNEWTAAFPEVGMDAQGNAIAVWRQGGYGWANRYSVGKGWGKPFAFGLDSEKMAMDAQGNAVVVWGGVKSVYIPATSWKAAVLLETDNAGHAQRPQVAMDIRGNAMAVWYQTDGTRYNIWANRYTAMKGWGTAQLIENDNASDAAGPQVAMDAQGNAIAVWQQSDGTRTNIWANRYQAGGGWGSASLIETDNAGAATVPQVAIDAAGNAIAVWTQSDGTRTNIWSNRYSIGTGWDTAALIETNNAGAASAPQVAIDGQGNALAVWEQQDGIRYNIWANRYSIGSGWGTATLIEIDNAGHARAPQVAMDVAGNATAVWYQTNGTRYNIWANRYTAGAGWGAATLIESDNTGDATIPQVAMDAQGNAIAVWAQSDGVRDNIWSNRYSPGIGWGTAALLETDNAGGAGEPQIAMDPQGNALAVWGQSDGTRSNIYGNWYTPGVGWGIPVLLETDNAGTARSPQVAMIAQGIATSVWQQSDGNRYNIWGNRRQQ